MCATSDFAMQCMPLQVCKCANHCILSAQQYLLVMVCKCRVSNDISETGTNPFRELSSHTNIPTGSYLPQVPSFDRPSHYHTMHIAACFILQRFILGLVLPCLDRSPEKSDTIHSVLAAPVILNLHIVSLTLFLSSKPLTRFAIVH